MTGEKSAGCVTRGGGKEGSTKLAEKTRHGAVSPGEGFDGLESITTEQKKGEDHQTKKKKTRGDRAVGGGIPGRVTMGRTTKQSKR